MEEVFCDATSCVMRNATTNMGRSLFAICLGILVNITHGFCISNVAWTSKIDFHAIMIFCRSKSLIVETILLLLTTLTSMICLFYHELEKALKLSLHFLFEFGCNAICCNSKHFYQDSFGIYFQEKLEIQCKDQFFLFVLHSFFTLFYLFCFDFVAKRNAHAHAFESFALCIEAAWSVSSLFYCVFEFENVMQNCFDLLFFKLKQETTIQFLFLLNEWYLRTAIFIFSQFLLVHVLSLFM